VSGPHRPWGLEGCAQPEGFLAVCEAGWSGARGALHRPRKCLFLWLYSTPPDTTGQVACLHMYCLAYLSLRMHAPICSILLLWKLMPRGSPLQSYHKQTFSLLSHTACAHTPPMFAPAHLPTLPPRPWRHPLTWQPPECLNHLWRSLQADCTVPAVDWQCRAVGSQQMWVPHPQQVQGIINMVCRLRISREPALACPVVCYRCPAAAIHLSGSRRMCL
jgi:hypothetical protein